MHRPWPPWWILTLIAVLAVCAGFLCQLVLFGPEPTGWCMTPVAGPGPEARYEITKVQGPSAGAPSGFEAGDAAARAGFEVGDLVLRKDVDAFAAHPQANTPYRFDIERRGDHKVLTLVLAQKDWGYWLRIERANTFMLFVSSILGLGLGALVIFMRPYNRTARWGALFLAQLGINLLLGGAGSNALQLESIPELAWAFRNLSAPLGATVLMGMSISLFAYLTLPVTASSLIEESPETRAKGKAGWASFWLPAPLVLLVALRLFWLPVYSRAGNSAIPAWIVGPTILIGIGYLVWAVILLVRHYGTISGGSHGARCGNAPRPARDRGRYRRRPQRRPCPPRSRWARGDRAPGRRTSSERLYLGSEGAPTGSESGRSVNSRAAGEPRPRECFLSSTAGTNRTWDASRGSTCPCGIGRTDQGGAPYS